MTRIRMHALAAAALLCLGTAATALAGGNSTGADIQVTGSASTGSPAAGDAFSYTFQIKNNGPQDALDVVFTDTLPFGTGFNYAVKTIVGSNYLCEGQGQTVSCNLGTMVKGRQYSVTINLDAPVTAGAFSDTGAAATASADPVAGNNAATVNAQVKVALGACPGQLDEPTVVGQVVQAFTVVTPNGLSFLDDMIVLVNGVRTYVFANFTDPNTALTQFINLNCSATPLVFLTTFVNVTGLPAGTVTLANGEVLPAIDASIIQVFTHKDAI